MVLDNENSKAYFYLGSISHLEGDIITARRNYFKAIENGYNDDCLLYNMALVDYSTHDYISCKYYLSAILERNPKNIQARIKMIELLINEKKYEDVCKYSEQIIMINPNIINIYHYYFYALLQLNNLEKALEINRKAISLFDNRYDFVFDRIMLYYEQERYSEALDYLNSCFIDNPKAMKRFLHQKAKILFKLKKYDECEKLIEGIDDKDIDDEIRFILLILFLSKEKYDKAIELCSSFEEKNIYYFISLYFKGYCLYSIHKVPEAQSTFEIAKQEITLALIDEPDNINLLVYRIMCEIYLNNLELAKELVDYAILLDEKCTYLHFIRGVIFRKMNEIEKSNEEFVKVKLENDILRELVSEVLKNK